MTCIYRCVNLINKSYISTGFSGLLADIDMIFWFYPAPGDLEYVTTFLFNMVFIQPVYLYVSKQPS